MIARAISYRTIVTQIMSKNLNKLIRSDQRSRNMIDYTLYTGKLHCKIVTCHGNYLFII